MEPLDIYQQFVIHRQETLINKMSNPGYISPILGTNKFTNVQRILDRTSQYELKNVIYWGSQELIDVLYRIFVFNQFKTVNFWEFYTQYGQDLAYVDAVNFASKYVAVKGKEPIFTHAYVVPGKQGELKLQTIINRCKHFKRLHSEGAFNSCFILRQPISSIFGTLKNISGIGDFLASQICFDLLWHKSTQGWTPLYQLGVGAVRGAYKLGLISSLKPSKHEIVDALNLALGVISGGGYQYLYANNKPIFLNIADVQNTFCEFDKYMRLVSPEVKAGGNSPTRIKAKYKPNLEPINYMVPGWMVSSEQDLIEVSKP